MFRFHQFGTLFVKDMFESVIFTSRHEEELSRFTHLHADPCTPDFESPGAKAMKNLKLTVCAAVLVTAVSATTFAKTGTISTTKAGTISTTKTGTISTTRTGTISTTRTGTISTTGISVDRFALVELLLAALRIW